MTGGIAISAPTYLGAAYVLLRGAVKSRGPVTISRSMISLADVRATCQAATIPTDDRVGHAGPN